MSPLTRLPPKLHEVSARVSEAPEVEAAHMFIPYQLEELNVAETVEPEFIEVEMAVDTGATVHAVDRVDIPGHEIQESPGSKAGQMFQCAGSKLLPNEGQATVCFLAPGGDVEMEACFQIAKVTRPLLSVTKITEKGDLDVLCTRNEARIAEVKTGKVLAIFKKKGGLYVGMVKVRNPKWQGFARPGQ